MGAITGNLKDSLRTAANGRFLTGLGQAAVFEDTLVLSDSAVVVTAGAVSITLDPNAQLVPDTLTYTFRVQDPSGVQRYIASGVTVTAAFDTLDDIL
jgi:hypothetical protein